MVCESSCASPKQGNLEQRRTDYDGFGEKCVIWRVLCLASMRMSVVDGGGLRMCFSINFDVHFKYVDSIPVKTYVFNVHTKALHEENERAASTREFANY